MTLIIQKPTGAKLVFAKDQVRTVVSDVDATLYIQTVEAADGQRLESGVATAINSFVLGCKADGIWTAIKASCILAGARTLTGALVPLAGAAPTNFNFVSGDYNRKTGLVGDGSTKYLDSNRNNNADPQNSKHISTYVTNHAARTSTQSFMGAGGAATGASTLVVTTTDRFWRLNSSNAIGQAEVTALAGLWGASRASSSEISITYAGVTTLGQTLASSTPRDGNILVYCRNNSTNTGVEQFTPSRIAFYSIGESLDLALLDARVTTLINAFDAAIP
jgi:hypothetical protein